jgi:hypothetical protein
VEARGKEVPEATNYTKIRGAKIVMSDDWARKYIDIHKQKQQEKQDAQERGRLARAGAPDMFQRIKDRIRQDLKTFYDAGVLHSLVFNDVSETNFAVNDMSPRTGSRPTLVVELDIILVKYGHLLSLKQGKNDPNRSTGALRICSDSEGVTQVYKNGETFADESEVSEFLLRPLLDFVDG